MNQINRRLSSIDLVRGIAMILMTLDHTRDYFSDHSLRIDLSAPTPGMEWLFFTRVITHFCAPTFVFLAGTSAFLTTSKTQDKPKAARLLVTRGLWLIFLEVTVIAFAWYFNFRHDEIPLAVIWAIGCAMIALAPMIFLPTSWIAIIAAVIIFGHNSLDGIAPETFGSLMPLWNILHVGFSNIGSQPKFSVIYPVLPWIGVMAAGYAFGPIFRFSSEKRRKALLLTGAIAIFSFVIIRGINSYGNPTLWTQKADISDTILSFVNTTKYPPSLTYLLMTLGPMFLMLACFESDSMKKWAWVETFGRVPLSYYILHLYLIHGLAMILALIQTGSMDWMMNAFFKADPPDNYGLNLYGVYAVWALVILILYPFCAWYSGYKSRNRSAWLSYL